ITWVRSSSSHQLLMREIEERPRAMSASAAAGLGGTLVSATSAGVGAPPSPSRLSMSSDAATIAAADEAKPMLHPDTLRRKRTLRDAGLAAKAAFSSTTPALGAGTASSGSGSGGGGGGFGSGRSGAG
ncbi:unnamed protein product, partial [Laminaria digitata]